MRTYTIVGNNSTDVNIDIRGTEGRTCKEKERRGRMAYSTSLQFQFFFLLKWSPYTFELAFALLQSKAPKKADALLKRLLLTILDEKAKYLA